MSGSGGAGFPRRGCANPQRGAPAYYLAKFFSENCIKWKKLDLEVFGGTRPWSSPLGAVPTLLLTFEIGCMRSYDYVHTALRNSKIPQKKHLQGFTFEEALFMLLECKDFQNFFQTQGYSQIIQVVQLLSDLLQTWVVLGTSDNTERSLFYFQTCCLPPRRRR